MATSDQRRKVGQLFAVGFHGTEPSDDIKSLIQDYGAGAIVLFKRNVQDGAQLQKLCRDLQQIARDAGHQHPLLIGIDQEGGKTTRISPPIAAQMPGPMTLAAAGSVEAVYEVAKVTGEMLQHMGINMNYAPVGDVNNEPRNPVIGVRSPGDDPEMVSQSALACAKGLRERHVVPCIKHFPGHGDTATDSHYGLPVIEKIREDMDKTELVPFRNAAKEGIEMVMTAHISLPNLAGSKLPATLSPEALSILRDDFKYEGVIMSECLEMDGVRATYGTVEGALMTLQAGADNVMICHTYESQTGGIDRVCAGLRAGEISQARIDQSLTRLEKLKQRLTSWDKALQTNSADELTAMNEKHEKLAQGIYAKSGTLVRSKAGLLPLSASAKTVFVTPGKQVPASGVVASGDGNNKTAPVRGPATYVEVIRQHNPSTEEIQFGDSGLSDEQWKQVEDADVVILATHNAKQSQYQQDVGLEMASRCGSKLVSIATCAPYDFLEEPKIETYAVTYEPTVEALGATANILYGKTSSQGKLPVAYKAVS